MIRSLLPSVGKEVKLDRVCPHCGRKNGQIHTAVRLRAVSDLKERAIAQRRLKCPSCRTTWTLRADGVGHGRQRSDRVRGLGVMLYMFGLSYRVAAVVLSTLECQVSKSSLESASGGWRSRVTRPVSFIKMPLGCGFEPWVWTGRERRWRGHRSAAGGLFFVDVERQQLLSVEPVDEKDAIKVRRHVSRVMRQMQAEELRTDEFSVYQRIVPEDRHHICLASFLRSAKGGDGLCDLKNVI